MKKDQAKVALELRELQKKSYLYKTKEIGYTYFKVNGQTRKARRMAHSDDYIEQCEVLYQECRKLKLINEEPNTTPITNEFSLPYLAGITDAEGCFSINKLYRADTPSPIYQARLTIAMIDPEPLQLALKVLQQGSFNPRTMLKSGKPYYKYIAASKAAEVATQLLLPYLQVKKKQAELLLEFRRLQSTSLNYRTKLTKFVSLTNKYDKTMNIPIYAFSDEYIEKCEEFRKKFNCLNKRGLPIS